MLVFPRDQDSAPVRGACWFLSMFNQDVDSFVVSLLEIESGFRG